ESRLLFQVLVASECVGFQVASVEFEEVVERSDKGHQEIFENEFVDEFETSSESSHLSNLESESEETL
ncbi:hypothetical protein LINPERHAP1_LOCUS14004, partial [Linum perenne]